MNHAVALTRKAQTIVAVSPLDLARVAIVLGSAAALMLAGQPLPF